MSIQRSDQKTTAGVLALVLGAMGLGGLGIHKFILGYTREGITSLLITFLTCGIGAAVLTVVSIIEGIIYLTKTDDDFYRTYVVGRKGWL